MARFVFTFPLSDATGAQRAEIDGTAEIAVDRDGCWYVTAVWLADLDRRPQPGDRWALPPSNETAPDPILARQVIDWLHSYRGHEHRLPGLEQAVNDELAGHPAAAE